MKTLLDRYVIREALRGSLLGVGLYSFVLLMNNFFLVARLALQKDLGPLTVAWLVALQMPRILLLTIPMGVLLGILVALGRLAADSELVALRSAGISTTRLVVPVLGLGLAGTLATAALYHTLIPPAHTESSRVRLRTLVSADLNREIRAGIFYDDIPGVVLYADKVFPAEPEWPLRGVFLRTEEPGTAVERILIGRRARIDRDAVTGALTFQIKRGEIHVLDATDPDSYSVSRFEEPYLQTFMPPVGYITPELAGSYRRNVPDLTTPELLEQIAARRERVGPERVREDFLWRKASIELHQRFALPFASMLFALIGLPLALLAGRGGRAAGFAVSLIVILAYWILFTIGRDMALEGAVPVAAGCWASSILLTAIAIALLLMVHRYETLNPVAVVSERFRAFASRLPGLRRGVGAGAGRLRRLRNNAAGAAGGGPGLTLVPLPTLADRYIGGLYLRMLAIVLLAVYTIVWVVVSRNLVESIAGARIPPGLLLQYVLYYSPGQAWYVLPVSAVVAAMTAVGLLDRNNEVTALRAAGVSVYRLTVPLVLTTLGVCGAYYVVQDIIAPATNAIVLRLEDRIEGRAATTVPGVRWIFGENRRLYAYRDYDPATKSFQGLSVFDLADGGNGIRRRVQARRARADGEGWLVEDGWRRTWRHGPESGRGEGDIDEFFERLAGESLSTAEGPGFFDRRERSFLLGSRLPEQMSFRELREHVEDTRRSGYDTRHLKVALYGKTAFPFTPLVMVLIGLPFAFHVGRRGSLYGLGIALGLVMVYWAVFAFFNALGLGGVVPPFMSAWAPNLLFSLGGLYLLLSLRS